MEERVKLSFWIDKNLFEELYRIKAEKKLRAYTHIMIEATKYVLNKYKKGELEIEKVKNGVRIIEVGKESEETLEEVEEIETMEESKEEEGGGGEEEIEEKGLMPALLRNYLDKHDAINNTARALTEKGLSFIAAPKLHHRR